MFELIQSYLFDPAAPADSPRVVAGLVGAAALLGGGVLVVTARRGSQLPRTRSDTLGDLAVIAGAAYLLLFFGRYQALQPFTSRAWVYAATLLFAGWLVVLVFGRRRNPLTGEEAARFARLNRYLPRVKPRLAKRPSR